jgi:hypothetical protein
VVEHVEHRFAQRLGAVEADQHRAGDIQVTTRCAATTSPATTHASPHTPGTETGEAAPARPTPPPDENGRNPSPSTPHPDTTDTTPHQQPTGTLLNHVKMRAKPDSLTHSEMRA